MNPDIQIRKPRTQTYLNITSFKSLATALSKGQLSQSRLIEETGLQNSTISRYLKILHAKPNNHVYIAAWRRLGERGNYTALWSWGYMMEDAPRPKPMNKSEYSRRYRLKKEKANEQGTCSLSR